jgi:hypothetical protein
MIRDTHYPLLQLTDQVDRAGHLEIGLALHQPASVRTSPTAGLAPAFFSHLPDETLSTTIRRWRVCAV